MSSMSMLLCSAKHSKCPGEDTIAAGEKAPVSLYGGVNEETLDALRYRQFCYTVLKSSSLVETQTLPPKSAAAEYHSLRMYYHVMRVEMSYSEYESRRLGVAHCGPKMYANTERSACHTTRTTRCHTL